MFGIPTEIWTGSAMTCFGMLWLLFPNFVKGRISKKYERHLADRLAAGEDRYFEELRSLETYNPKTGSNWYRSAGTAALATGLFVLNEGIAKL